MDRFWSNFYGKPYKQPSFKEPLDYDLTLYRCVYDICLVTKVSPDLIFSRSKKREAVRPRFMVFYLLSSISGVSNSKIAITFNIDVSSVWHGVQQVKKSLEEKNWALQMLKDLEHA